MPATVGSVPGAEVGVTGITAESKDFNDQIKTIAPRVFVFVLILAFTLMLFAFRLLVIAAEAIILNLLASVAAAYGVLVLVFQHGFAKGLLGFDSTAGVDGFLLVFLFVILFGLSMDYHVFILSRIREAYDQGMTTDEAITHGIKTTAGVVTSAAVVMVFAFSIFATLSVMIFKQFGVGLAVAILIDATLIRAVLLPATMKLLGEWNWYLPNWLNWLPHFEHPTTVEAREPTKPKPIPGPPALGRPDRHPIPGPVGRPSGGWPEPGARQPKDVSDLLLRRLRAASSPKRIRTAGEDAGADDVRSVERRPRAAA